MRVFSIAKGFHKLTKGIPSDLSSKELDRLRAITIWGKTKDVLLVCKTFGISRATFYRWLGSVQIVMQKRRGHGIPYI